MKLTATLFARSALLILFVTLSSLSAASEPAALCKEFRKLLDAPPSKGIDRYLLEKSIPIGGNMGDERYFNVDIDGDDISDILTTSCSNSSIPADPCRLDSNLSSGNKIEFEEDRFYLVRYRTKIYAVAGHTGAKSNVGKRRIFRIDESGAKLLCSNL